MTMIKVIPFLAICILTNSCLQSQTNNKGVIKNEELGIESLKIVPKKSFEYNTLVKSANDTLELVSCAKYVLYPFGSMKEESELKNSLLKSFKIISKETQDSMYYSYQLRLGNNKLTVSFDNDPDASAHSNILNGEIIDGSVSTVNEIKVGMSVDSFLRLHFESFPNEIENTYKVIIFDYCVNGIQHIYNFSNGKLKKIDYK